MAEVFAGYAPDDQSGIVVYEKRTQLPGGRFKRGAVRGHHRVDGWLDDELKIIRMRWHHDVPNDLR